jgi:P4 family phage/plasmid primase-like protien
MSAPDIAAVTALRAQLWDAGFRPVPVFNADADVASPGKQPLGKAWQVEARRDPPFCATSPAVAHARNTGILCDGLRPIDFDIDDGDVARQCRAIAFDMLGEAPIRTRRGSPRCLMLYRAAIGEPSKIVLPGRLGKIEILGRGQQFVAFGMHPSGAELEWFPNTPGSELRNALRAVTEDGIAEFLAACAPIIDAPLPVKSNGHDHAGREPQAELARIAEALASIPNAGPPDWEFWNRIGMATWRATNGSEEGFVIWCGWSAKNPSHDQAAARARWLHYRISPPSELGAGTIFHEAAEARRRAEEAAQPDEDPSPADDTPDATDGEPVPIRFSENALAHLFTAEHAERLLFVPEWGKWLRWQSGRWQEDFAVSVFDAARRICAREGNIARSILPRSGAKIATTINKAAAVAAIERLARHHAGHARPSRVFDASPFALNQPDSIVDLRTGLQRAQQPLDYVTRSTTVSASSRADCPTWTAFLARIMGNDEAMVAYLQRVCGYMLTGSVVEHVVFFGHGGGANGKSTFANVLAGILGVGLHGYAAVAPISTFTASTHEQHPTDLAMLRGRRCVLAQETEEGRHWAIAKLKMMTGGDPISARFMRQDFFTYRPQFKVLILGNHKPALRGADEATRRRFHLIPFTVTIPPAERDKTLGDKLRAEYAAILAWMLEGCAAWQRDGLMPPEKVLAATSSYLADEDTLPAWIVECCLTGPNYHDTAANLFACWKAWCDANGEHPGRRRDLSEQLETHGFKRRPRSGDQLVSWNGIMARPSPRWRRELVP